MRPGGEAESIRNLIVSDILSANREERGTPGFISQTQGGKRGESVARSCDWALGIRSTRELTGEQSGMAEREFDGGEDSGSSEGPELDSANVSKGDRENLGMIEGERGFHTVEELLVRTSTLVPNPKQQNRLSSIHTTASKSLPTCRIRPGNHLPVHNQRRRTCVLCTWTRQQDSHIREELASFTQETLTKELGTGGKFWVEGRGNYKKVQLPGGLGKRPARSWVSCKRCVVFLCQPLCFHIWHSWKCS